MVSSTDSTDVILKITLIGDWAVGKTSLRRRFMGQSFVTQYMGTLGADFGVIEKEIDDMKVSYQIWDLAGQSGYEGVRRRYYDGTHGSLVVFDTTRPSSLKNLKGWISELWENNGKGKIPLVILGNKSDLPQKVSDEDVMKFVDDLNEQTAHITYDYGFEVEYIKTSALTGENIDQAFITLGRLILEKSKR
ncbi:MAG: GTP-binding protein [Candidatus Heimdallarchaeota archaeon]|nr:GTP-binding protein [Candidatus Heimdallarchaeota archaeon]MCK5049509.1 GTP-binding protein [Candidatus Heimdallarchaeota archaeon]